MINESEESRYTSKVIGRYTIFDRSKEIIHDLKWVYPS